MNTHSILLEERKGSSHDRFAHAPRPYVTAVMPCLNEEKTVATCVEKARQCLSKLGIPGEVIVADNGSTDRSAELAKAAGATVVHVRIKGYGAALGTAIQHAQGEIIIMGDSDDSYDWSDLEGFIKAIEAGNDLVMGNRFRGGIQPGAMPPLHRYLGNPALSLISRIAFNAQVGDFHCGMRAFTAHAFSRMKVTSTGMEFATEMVANSVHEGLKIFEIPIKLYPDKRDRPPHLRSFRDGWRHLRFIFSHAPDRIFVLPGAVMATVGILLLSVLLSGPRLIAGHYFGVHFVILGAMLCLIGMNIIPMGILAKMILGLGPSGRSRTLRVLLSQRYLLEAILAGGGIALTFGLAIDLSLLVRWLNTTSGLENTVHLAIAGSTSIVIGIEAMFFAFLLYLAHEYLGKNLSDAEDIT